MSLTITSLRSKHGYSGVDHLIDDIPLETMIGQEYESVEDIRAAVTAIQREHADKRVRDVPVSVEARLDTGDLTTITA